MLNEWESIPAQANARKTKVDFIDIIIISLLTIVAALNAEPKSIPMISPDDVSIRKLNKYSENLCKQIIRSYFD